MSNLGRLTSVSSATLRQLYNRPLSRVSLVNKSFGIPKSTCSCMFQNKNFSFPEVATPSVNDIGRVRFITTTRSLFKKKSKRSSQLEEEDEENPEEDDEFDVLGKGEKILDVRLGSDRVDAVLKAGLGMSRNKIEKAFYSDRVRINGQRPKKKSQSVDEGDEVDFIIRYNKKTPEYLDVSRVEVLKLGPYPSAEDDDEPVVPAKIKRSRNLTIENYTVPFRGNIDDD